MPGSITPGFKEPRSADTLPKGQILFLEKQSSASSSAPRAHRIETLLKKKPVREILQTVKTEFQPSKSSKALQTCVIEACNSSGDVHAV